jgi:hypothetical protein
MGFKNKVGLPLNTFDMNFFGIIYSKYVVWAWLLSTGPNIKKNPSWARYSIFSKKSIFRLFQKKSQILIFFQH